MTGDQLPTIPRSPLREGERARGAGARLAAELPRDLAHPCLERARRQPGGVGGVVALGLGEALRRGMMRARRRGQDQGREEEREGDPGSHDPTLAGSWSPVA